MTTITFDQIEEFDSPVKKGGLGRLFNKLADVGARGAVTGAFRIAAVTTLVGAGASSFVTVGVAAVASGVGAAAYAYTKDLMQDVMLARKENRKVSLWNADRKKKVKIALLAGAAGGAFGAWLAGTDTFKEGLAFVKEAGLHMLDRLTDGMAVHAAEIPAVSAVAPPVAVDAAVPSPRDNVVGRLWDMVMASEEAKGKLMKHMLIANPEDAKSVSAQFLKDRAHDILRMNDIPLADRMAMANDLATEAKARGNKQAGAFLADLAKMASKYVADAKVAVVTAPVAPVVPAALSDLPVVDVPAQSVTEVTVTEFREAGKCLVSGPDQGGAFDVMCKKIKDFIMPGDHLSFVHAGHDTVKGVVPYTADSVPVETDKLMAAPQVINDGVKKVAESFSRFMASFPKP